MLNSTKIKDRMHEKGITQKEVAGALGLAGPTVSQKINGIRPMDLEEAKIIAGMLDIDAGDFGTYFFAS